MKHVLQIAGSSVSEVLDRRQFQKALHESAAAPRASRQIKAMNGRIPESCSCARALQMYLRKAPAQTVATRALHPTAILVTRG